MLFSSPKKSSQVGVEFQPAGVAVVQVQSGTKAPGRILRNAFLAAQGQTEQLQQLQQWVRSNQLQKTPCVCLIASDDYDVFQIDKPNVDDAELHAALGWRIKDLVSYEVDAAVVDAYPMPLSSKNKTQQLSVVAAQESVVRSYVDGIKASGLKLSAIDIHDLVSKNLKAVQRGETRTQAILALAENEGFLSIFHDCDLYVSRDFKIGLEQLQQASAEDQSVYDALLLEIQRSMDYFESYYGLGSISTLQIFPQLAETEKMALYLQNYTGFDIDFLSLSGKDQAQNLPTLESHCFNAYCAALRDLAL